MYILFRKETVKMFAKVLELGKDFIFPLGVVLLDQV
jgi:hypothetical protein